MKYKKSSEIENSIIEINDNKLLCLSCKKEIKEKGICPFCGVKNIK